MNFINIRGVDINLEYVQQIVYGAMDEELENKKVINFFFKNSKNLSIAFETQEEFEQAIKNIHLELYND